MRDETYKYYMGFKTGVTGKELKSIPSERYDEIERLAAEDVRNERKVRTMATFRTEAEYKAYLLNIIDFAQKEKNGITPILGNE